MTMSTQEALAEAKRLKIKPGDTIYCVLRHVAPSSMSRRISFFVMRDNKPCGIDHVIAAFECAGARWSTRDGRIQEGVHVPGVGVDMGFAVVYDLGQSLWPKGTSKPHSTRNGQPDTEGGYALRSEWL